jgi:UDP-N-acetylglucosamine 1-carboxyvinyltransferase
VAALSADGFSVIDDIEYIQRGYENFEGKLSSLGGNIEKVDNERDLQKFKLKIG